MKKETKTAEKPAAGAQVPATVQKNLPASPIDYGSVGRVGLENTTKEDFSIPFLVILQKLSPQVDERDDRYIEGAKAGMILNTATQECFDGKEGVLFIPCTYQRKIVAWGTREAGGGFKGEHLPGEEPKNVEVDSKNRTLILPERKVQLVDTRLFGGLLVGAGFLCAPALISMTSTQIKKAKRWNTQMDGFQNADGYPIFARAYRLTTIPESNDQGSWDGWKIEVEGLLHEVMPDEEAAANAFVQAKQFFDSLKSGEVKLRADAPEDHAGSSGRASSDPAF